MKKQIVILLAAVLLVLSGCTLEPEQTSAVSETVTENVTETEPVVTEPDETVSVKEPTFATGFKFEKVPTETVVEVSGTSDVKVKNAEYTVEFESTFYGPQSLIDRDSHHMGDLYVAANYAKEYPADTDYYFGEFTGDRFSEYIICKDGELKIYKGKGRYTRYDDSKLLFTQKIELDGELRGTGDFNGDLYSDMLFVTNKKTAFIAYGGEDGFDFVSVGILPGAENYGKENFYTGDMNADGLTDIIAVKGFDTASWRIKDGKAEKYSDMPLYIKDEYVCCCVGDINTDGVCDLVVAIPETGLRTFFGQKDGQFGPHENEADNVNFCPLWEHTQPIKYMAVGDTNEDGVSDIIATMKLKASNVDFLVCSLTYPTEAPAYDYSTHILKKEDGTYILYNGGLYVDYNKEKYTPTDGDHVLVYTSEDGKHFIRNMDAPAFYLGGELGVSGEWWTGNTIEPEVIYVDGTYYMGTLL